MSDRIEAESLDVFGEEVDAAVDTPFVVIKGPKGDPGAAGKDGHSPVVTATKSGKTTTISADGTAIATVEDGADGAPGKDGADGQNGAPGAKGKDGVTPTIGSNGNWYLGATDTGKPSRGETGPQGTPGKDGVNGETGPAGPQGLKGTDGITPHIGSNGNWYLGDTDTGVSAGGGTADAVLYTAQTLTGPQQGQARKNIGALGAVTPTIRGGLFVLESDPAGTPIQVQAVGYQQSATGEEYSELSITDTSLQATSDQIIISGLADFGDAEAAGMPNTAVSYSQLINYTKPIKLTYANGQVTGEVPFEIYKAINRGRQITLSVPNLPDIIASKAINESNAKSIVTFINTIVSGDTVTITEYTVTAQASGLTMNVKSHEIADGSEVSY